MHETTAQNGWKLGSDTPQTDPAHDEFGYAPFASQIAKSVVSISNPQGLVLAVHGKWGAGKSSLLNFIKHELRTLEKDDQPILVDFNPWWFEGREQIATQLLEQFSAQLPDRLAHARKLAKLVGTYSKQIASVAADYSGYAWIKEPLAWLVGKIPGLSFLSEKSGVPQIKKKVANALRDSGKRFVFFVDDIDRLTPAEAADLFRAIKALADFPEVVYILFFDREEVAKGLSAHLSMDGEAYLEKIIQAPFHLPAVDRTQLRQKLFRGLDSIIETRPMPFAFDKGRWSETFNDGLEHCIRKPRDVVRLLNAISVTYPPLAREVNPVDFIALECLRVFYPGVYMSIRDGQTVFCGQRSNLDNKKSTEKAYFEKWRESLPDEARQWLVSLVGRIFPKAEQLIGGGGWLTHDDSAWRKALRPCSPECFDVYFQFGIPEGRITRTELDLLVSLDSPEEMADFLLGANDQISPNGRSKIADVLDRLRDFDDLGAERAGRLVTAIISVSHRLLRQEERQMFSPPARWRISSLASRLMEQLDVRAQQGLMEHLASTSPGLPALVTLTDMALTSKTDPSEVPKGIRNFDTAFVDQLTSIIATRLDNMSLEELISIPELDYVVHRWAQWGDKDTIHSIFAPMLEDDHKLLDFLDKFIRTGLSQTGNVTTETYQLSMGALAATIDVDAVEPRIRALQLRDDLTVRQRAAVDRYLKGQQRARDGLDPDGFYFED
ncbi:P-loop NTPase fold protein [Pandoraea sp. NPDC087047]|uniref:KAP family P-loop NTPase fold protein n=1 Tax=Pandoraea sp. NPDC087047 TaxID=3364390 RepID=UPI003809D99D